MADYNEKQSDIIKKIMDNENQISIKEKIEACFSNNLPSLLLQLDIHDSDAINAINENLEKEISLKSSNLSNFISVLLLSSQNWLNDFLLNKINLPLFVKETREKIHNLEQQIDQKNQNQIELEKQNNEIHLKFNSFETKERVTNIENQFKQQINELNQTKDQLKQQINDINQKINSFETKERVTNVENQFKKQITDINQKINNYETKERVTNLENQLKKQINDINQKINSFETKERVTNLENQLKKQITDINQKINNHETKERVNNIENQFKKQINDINQKINNHETKERVTNVENQLKKQISDLKQNVTNYQTNNNKINDSNRSNISTIQKQIGDVSNSLKNFDQRISQIRNRFVTFDLNPGRQIHGNVNLDSFREIGSYFCNSNLEAPTIKNLPGRPRAFRLIVGSACGSDYEIFQEFTFYDTGAKYYRLAHKGINYAWLPWNKISVVG